MVTGGNERSVNHPPESPIEQRPLTVRKARRHHSDDAMCCGLRDARERSKLADGQIGPQGDAGEEHALRERPGISAAAASVPGVGNASHEHGELFARKPREDEPRIEHHAIVNVRSAA